MIKRILVPLDPSPYTETATDIACAVARRHGAELTGLAVLDIPGIERSIGPVPGGAFYYAEKLEAQKEREARGRIQALLARFKAKCEKEGVAHREAECQGSPSDMIIQESIFYDLVVTGLRTHFHFETSDKPGDSLEEVLGHTVTPVYGVPEKLAPQGKTKALIAFDGSLPAARAMQRFVHLADPGETEIRVVMSDSEEEKANYYLDRAEDYLKAYAVVNIEKVWTTQHIIQAIEEAHMDWASVFVVGAHARAGLLDFFVGSLTRHLIDAAKKPVFIG